MEYIDYSLSWIEKLKQKNFSESTEERLRLEEFLNKIHSLKNDILIKDLGFVYSRGLEDYRLSKLIAMIDDIYHFKNSYGIKKETYSELEESLETLSSMLSLEEGVISQKLDVYEKYKFK
jgi:hypothetical protein